MRQYGDIVFDYGTGDFKDHREKIEAFTGKYTPEELKSHQKLINLATKHHFIYFANLGLLRAHPLSFVIAISFMSAIYYVCGKNFAPWTERTDPFWTITNKVLNGVADSLAEELNAEASYLSFDLHRLFYRTPTLNLP